MSRPFSMLRHREDHRNDIDRIPEVGDPKILVGRVLIVVVIYGGHDDERIR